MVSWVRYVDVDCIGRAMWSPSYHLILYCRVLGRFPVVGWHSLILPNNTQVGTEILSI